MNQGADDLDEHRQIVRIERDIYPGPSKGAIGMNRNSTAMPVPDRCRFL
ncbi:hypothetical protein [Paraburkholderia tuberum]|nr:hypothetical protein [Paraburkholderia tuberum]